MFWNSIDKFFWTCLKFFSPAEKNNKTATTNRDEWDTPDYPNPISYIPHNNYTVSNQNHYDDEFKPDLSSEFKPDDNVKKSHYRHLLDIKCQSMPMPSYLLIDLELENNYGYESRPSKQKLLSFFHEFNEFNDKMFKNGINILLLPILSIDWTVFITKSNQDQSGEEFYFHCIEQSCRELIPLLKSDIKLQYDCISHYKYSNMAMIIINTMAQIEKEMTTKLPNDYLNMSLLTSTINHNSHLVHVIFDCRLSREAIFEKRRKFINHIVSIRLNGDANSDSYLLNIGYIANSVWDIPRRHSTGRLFFSVIMTSSFHQKLSRFSNKEWIIKPLFYLRPAVRLIETLAYLEQYRSQSFQSLIRLDPNLCHNQNKIMTLACKPLHNQKQYNEKQQAAIVAACDLINLSTSTLRILMVQGPPGTGKTHILLGIIRNIMADSITKFQMVPFRIMICAPSNGAIDEIGLRIASEKTQLLHGRLIKMVRIGMKSRMHTDLVQYELETMIDAVLGEEEKKLGYKRASVRQEIISNADIILTTLSSCQNSALDIFRSTKQETIRISNNVINCLIIDEASQCIEPEILMPLVYESITKVIMIGDPLQLPATVISSTAKNANYGRSLFERFDTYFSDIKSDKQSPIIRLTQQFRMHKDICSFPSKQFYNSTLETANGSGFHTSVTINPYFIFDILDSQESSSQSSKSNPTEVMFICKLFRQILDKICYKPWQPLPASIGIITFYQEQKQALIAELSEQFSSELVNIIKIDTVDAFQGQECDIVILSCVRAPDDKGRFGSIGFVRSQQRMNVALTRARCLLCVCLHSRTFSRAPIWKQMLLDAEQRNRLFSVSSKIQDSALKSMLV
ncbi:putative helicase senataxin isoform X1 [Dermatophagoides farinae]|uniref:putative helicase senataxin isoform X1 n=1 Tax=Dermatophagoides farinae TaxID=6954 RepID=UPI001F1118A6|nr:probable helicase senataxin isoform X1 [Dermatophagoides farinae]